jgi:hypothetical protein
VWVSGARWQTALLAPAGVTHSLFWHWLVWTHGSPAWATGWQVPSSPVMCPSTHRSPSLQATLLVVPLQYSPTSRRALQNGGLFPTRMSQNADSTYCPWMSRSL